MKQTMVAEATSLNVGARAGRKSELLTTLVLAFVSLWLLAAVDKLLALYYMHASVRSGVWATVPILGALLFSFLFSRTRYSDFVPLLRFAFKSSALGLLVYLIVEPPDFTVAYYGEAVGRAQYVLLAYFLAVALGVASLFLPSFVVPVAFYILSTRFLVESISGLTMSTLDIRYMIDMVLYLALFAIPAVVIGPSIHPYFRDHSRQIELTFVAFGLHLGNYFWSGMAKLLVGPHLWTWVFENRTFNTIPYSIENGTLPIGHLPWLVDFAHGAMQSLVIPLNLSIAGFQLLAIVAIFRMSWLKIASLYYDLLHLGIWLFGGLFFWPWIWNNFTILLAARAERSPIHWPAKLACLLTILLGYPALGLHQSAWLGWFDVTDARQTYFEAVAKDGHVARVPSSFFLSHSYSVSHGYMDTAPHQGQYAHTWWGSASYDRHRSSGTCPEPEQVPPDSLETNEKRTARLNQVGRFIRAHHAKMEGREEAFGKGSFYFRSHHHPSNPYLFRAFDQLSLNDIVGYNLVVESVCHRMKDGNVEKTVVGRLVEYFDVK